MTQKRRLRTLLFCIGSFFSCSSNETPLGGSAVEPQDDASSIEGDIATIGAGGANTAAGGKSPATDDGVGGSEDGPNESIGIGGGSSTGGGSSGGSLSTGGVPTGGSSSEPPSGGTAGLADPCFEYSDPTKTGELQPIQGPSGMVASRAQPGVFYVHADAGADSVFFAVDQSGTLLAQFDVPSATHTDWEDIATGLNDEGDAVLYLGDIGDNAARSGGSPRDDIRLYRIREPEVSLGQEPVTQDISDSEVLIFVYPETPHDAEALFVDPTTGDLVFITKEDNSDFFVFRASGNTMLDSPTLLELVAEVSSPGNTPAPVSAGDISPTGDQILLRTLEGVLLWPHTPGSPWAETFEKEPLSLTAANEPQSEGITFSANAQSWYTAGEQSGDIFEAIVICD